MCQRTNPHDTTNRNRCLSRLEEFWFHEIRTANQHVPKYCKTIDSACHFPQHHLMNKSIGKKMPQQTGRKKSPSWLGCRYADCITAEAGGGETSILWESWIWHSTASDTEALVLELRRIQSISSKSLLPGPLWPGLVVTVRIPPDRSLLY